MGILPIVSLWFCSISFSSEFLSILTEQLELEHKIRWVGSLLAQNFLPFLFSSISPRTFVMTCKWKVSLSKYCAKDLKTRRRKVTTRAELLFFLKLWVLFTLYYSVSFSLVVEQLFKTYLTFQATFQNYIHFISRTLSVERKMQVFLGFRGSPVFKSFLPSKPRKFLIS